MNEARCKLRNIKGSEFGTCTCEMPSQCPDPPKITPVGRRFRKFVQTSGLDRDSKAPPTSNGFEEH